MSRNSRDQREPAAWVAPLAVALLTFVAFLPVLTAGFVTWDDDRNFLDNPLYRGLGLSQLRWMWTTTHMGHYIPLSWMTLGLDYVTWGMNPVGYHLTNLVLHTANAVVLYVLAHRLLRLAVAPPAPPSDSSSRALQVPAAFAALLFAIHPLRVESVAWITERRDMLSLLFFLLSILSYLRFAERTESQRRWYWLAVVLFVCALLSKGTSVTLPAVLLILNVYPLKRLGGSTGWWSSAARRVYLEATPFALLAAAASMLTILALHPPDQLELSGKLAVSAYSLGFYLWKTIVPVSLSPLYEMPKHINPTDAVFLVSYLVVIGLTALAWSVRRRFPVVTAAWAVFLIIVLPMLGIVQNGPQIAADRYTYHAAPALAILAGAGLALLERRAALALRGIGAAVLVALGALTWNQTKIWHDSETLWSQVLRVDDASSIAHVALGSLLIKQDRLSEGIEHYERGVAIDPDYAEGHNNLGVALAREGRFAEAIGRYQRSLALKPAYSDAHNNWGIALSRTGNLDAAIEHFSSAIAIAPNNADAQINWGNALVRLGRLDEAIQHYQQAVRSRPDNADAHLNWGVALAQQGKLTEAIEHFQQALAIKPDHAEAQEYLERALQLQQRSNGRSR